MAVTNAVRYEQEVGDILEQLGGVHQAIAHHSLDHKIRHLVEIRASQINQCGFCIKMHSAEARAAGETSERLERLIVWRHIQDFSDSEKAALAWTEALTELDLKADYGPLRAELKEYFSDKEISALTMVICMINLWNRFQISKH
ncbi:carboxymuconolactone decarboxylase family protein [Kiloniella antarctica]|uniref:Carboxymuconolactone decarboxylase family protein n=1 Tax=Kiloniella antarctica TaxID=1550907 RepID=A0ABW5BDT1_9PROT